MQSPAKHSLAALIFILVATAIVCGQAGAVYSAAEAGKHIGENATVTDRIDSVHQSGKGNIFLNMGGKYPNQAFTAYIRSNNAGEFPDYQNYDGKTVAVSGKITLYRGKPEIIVTRHRR